MARATKVITLSKKISLVLLLLPLMFFVVIAKAFLKFGGMKSLSSLNNDHIINKANADVGGDCASSCDSGNENSASGCDSSGTGSGDCGTGGCGGDSGDTGGDSGGDSGK